MPIRLRGNEVYPGGHHGMRVRGQRARRGRRSGVSSESSDSRRRRESKEKTPSPVPRAESPGRLEDQPIAGPSSAFNVSEFLSSSRTGIGYIRDEFEAVRGEEEMESWTNALLEDTSGEVSHDI